MKKIITITTAIMLIITSVSFGQLVTKVLSYNGTGNQIDKCTGIVQDNFGFVYATGVSMGLTGTKEDYATVKYGEDGDFIWAVRYDGPGHNLDYASAITIDNAGNIYVTGWSRTGTGYGSEDYYTIKYNNNGQQLWAARYDGAVTADCYYYDYAKAIVVDYSGNVYVTGESWGNDNLNGDYLTIKYNSSGAIQWAKRYNGPSSKNDYATSIGLDPSGNVYVTGASEMNGKGYDYLSVKYSPTGQQLWTARYDGPAYLDDKANELRTDGGGNLYVTGSSHGGTSKLDYVTIKYNTAGTQQWLKRYSNPATNDTDVATGIDIDVYTNVYVTGYSKGPVVGTSPVHYDFATIKYQSSDGAQLWLDRVDGGGSDKAWDIKVVNKGCIQPHLQGGLGDIPCWDVFAYVTGESYKTGSGNDFLTVGYNEFGVQKWTSRFNGPQNGNDAGYSVSVNASSSLIYSGGVFASDYGIIGIQELTRTGPSDFQGLSTNYPNPFNPTTNINYVLLKESNVKITVFDILGRTVASLVDEKKTEGSYSVTFDASNLNSGVYFYKVETSYANETKKIVLIK
ncbi:MAG: SBBP repeat-containing protein [Ignavibacteria bacterium]